MLTGGAASNERAARFPGLSPNFPAKFVALPKVNPEAMSSLFAVAVSCGCQSLEIPHAWGTPYIRKWQIILETSILGKEAVQNVAHLESPGRAPNPLLNDTRSEKKNQKKEF